MSKIITAILASGILAAPLFVHAEWVPINRDQAILISKEQFVVNGDKRAFFVKFKGEKEDRNGSITNRARSPGSIRPEASGASIMYILICILVGLVIGLAFGRSRSHALSFQNRRSEALSFQNRGEARLSREIQTHFVAPNYHLMNHITLRMQDGTTQVDHILVSRFGVFVIETKHYKGWIFANGKHAKWTQALSKGKFQFQNPMFQNLRHVRAVQELLDFLPAGCIKSVVVFTGDAEFKTEVPPGVFSLSGFVDHIYKQTTEIMSLNHMQFCVGRLETARLAITNQTDVEHIENLRRKHRIAA